MNLKDLNEPQRQAVRTTEGPVLLLAGAGSGKTRVLTYRIAYLIDNCGVDPYNILAITFTNKAAGEMRERVDRVAGMQAGRVWVSTFHSACVRILRTYGDRLGYTSGFSIYDTDDQKAAVREICKQLEIDTKRLNEKTILREISRAKDELTGPAQYREVAGSDFYQRKIAQVYEEYEKRLKKSNAMDFDDLIFRTIDLFTQEPDVLKTYQERFRYIMVDEYQDTNTSQFRLVSMLAGGYRNLCVVGDDDQSIYRFRGANIYNILNFEKTYPGATVIRLEQNYRSTQMILDAANAVIANNTERKAKKLWTQNDPGQKIALNIYADGRSEAAGVVDKIKQLHRDGWEYNRMAILYRTNAQSRVLEERFVYEGIPYSIFGGVNFYARREVKDILAYLKALINPDDEQSMRRIINVPRRGIGDTTLGKVSDYALADPELSFWDALGRVDEIQGIAARTAGKIRDFVDMMDELANIAKTSTVRETVDAVIQRSGYMTSVRASETSDEAQAREENLNELLTKAAAFDAEHKEDNNGSGPTLADFLQDVSLVADIDRMNDENDLVTLMTLHSAKGLEFDIVFMTGMEDGLFPSYMSLMSDDDKAVEEERRLCYVGITRAKKQLYLSSARSRMIRGETQYNKLSRFVEEIPKELLEEHDESNFFAEPDRYDRVVRSINEEKALAKDSDRQESGSLSKETGKRILNTYATKLSKPYSDNKVSVSFDKRLEQYKTRKKQETSGTKLSFGRDPSELSKGPYKKDPSGSGFFCGERVVHPRFGLGTVKAIEDAGRDYLLTVDFDEAGTRRIMEGFARMSKADQDS